MKSIAIVQNDANDGPGYFATWLAARGLPVTVFHMFDGDTLPLRADAHSGWCVLGGSMSANDPLPYFAPLLALIRAAVDADIPVIGHCLGGQLLACAVGGTVQASEHVEIGWSALEVIGAEAPGWFGSTPQLPMFQWHSESFSLPLGATWLVRGPHCAHQAFALGHKHLGMQFHCEVDEAKVRAWLHLDAAEIAAHCSPGVQAVAQIEAHLAEHVLRSQAVAHHIYKRWAQGLMR